MEAAGKDVVRVRLDSLISVRDALLANGVKLVDDGDATAGGPGVRLSLGRLHRTPTATCG